MGYIIKPPTGGGGGTIDSGLWTPTITTTYNSSSLIKAIFFRADNAVNFYIEFQLNNPTGILAGDTFFTPPTGLPVTTNILGMMAFRQNSGFANDNIDSFQIASYFGDIGFSMINTLPAINYFIYIQGIYLLT
jgi:hypothetical protein